MTSETDGKQRAEFRNRPGRDLLLALLIAYLILAIPAVVLSQDVMALVGAGLAAALVPLGVLMGIMKGDLFAAVGLGLIVALAVVFAIRMPGIIRVPALVVIFAGLFYCVQQAGTVLA